MTIDMLSFGSAAARGAIATKSQSNVIRHQVVYETRQVVARSSSKPALRGFSSPKVAPCRLMSRMTCHAASTSTVSDSDVTKFVDEEDNAPAAAAKVSFSRVTPETRLAAAAVTASAIGFSVLSDDLPALRLGMLTYMLWAAGEWVVHQYFMHAKRGSFADRLTHLNTLHGTHHIDTRKDMTMDNGYEVDALYFHFPNSIAQIVFASAVGLLADSMLSLDIPGSWIPVAAVLGMATHNTLWNTLHMGMHEIPGEYGDGMPCAPFVYQLAPLKAYRQWVYDNHTTHHDVGGGSNYNIVCPGPDFLLGTYMHRSKNVDCM